MNSTKKINKNLCKIDTTNILKQSFVEKQLKLRIHMSSLFDDHQIIIVHYFSYIPFRAHTFLYVSVKIISKYLLLIIFKIMVV